VAGQQCDSNLERPDFGRDTAELGEFRSLGMALTQDFLDTLAVMVERWRRDYNEVRPHSAIGNKMPDPLHS